MVLLLKNRMTLHNTIVMHTVSTETSKKTFENTFNKQ